MARAWSPPSAVLGAIAIASYVIHAGVHLSDGNPHHLLWMCHLASLLVGFGLLCRWPNANVIGFLWSCVGTPLWILDTVTGGQWYTTAVLTHGSGIIIGFIGVQRLGLPRAAALKAIAAYVPLWALTRAVTPPAANVNVAFSVYEGWQTWFTSYPPYFAMLLGFGLLMFIAVERMLIVINRTKRPA
jgi:hypothetical protein